MMLSTREVDPSHEYGAIGLHALSLPFQSRGIDDFAPVTGKDAEVIPSTSDLRLAFIQSGLAHANPGQVQIIHDAEFHTVQTAIGSIATVNKPHTDLRTHDRAANRLEKHLCTLRWRCEAIAQVFRDTPSPKPEGREEATYRDCGKVNGGYGSA